MFTAGGCAPDRLSGDHRRGGGLWWRSRGLATVSSAAATAPAAFRIGSRRGEGGGDVVPAAPPQGGDSDRGVTKSLLQVPMVVAWFLLVPMVRHLRFLSCMNALLTKLSLLRPFEQSFIGNWKKEFGSQREFPCARPSLCHEGNECLKSLSCAACGAAR